MQYTDNDLTNISIILAGLLAKETFWERPNAYGSGNAKEVTRTAMQFYSMLKKETGTSEEN